MNIIMNSSYVQWLMHRSVTKTLPHSIFPPFWNILVINHIFKLPWKWVKFDKKQKIFNFSRSTSSSASCHFNGSFISWAVGTQKTIPPSIFTLFKNIVVITLYFQIAINVIQLWQDL